MHGLGFLPANSVITVSIPHDIQCRDALLIVARLNRADTYIPEQYGSIANYPDGFLKR